MTERLTGLAPDTESSRLQSEDVLRTPKFVLRAVCADGLCVCVCCDPRLACQPVLYGRKTLFLENAFDNHESVMPAAPLSNVPCRVAQPFRPESGYLSPPTAVAGLRPDLLWCRSLAEEIEIPENLSDASTIAAPGFVGEGPAHLFDDQRPERRRLRRLFAHGLLTRTAYFGYADERT
jgi:hypothetical protein